VKELKLVLVKAGSFTMGSKKKDIKQLIGNFPDFEPKLLEREIPDMTCF